MFCPKCGTKLKDTDAFCPVCGTQINQKPHQTPYQTPHQTPQHKLFIPGMIAAGVLCLVCIIAFFSTRGQKPSSAEEVFANMQNTSAEDCTIDIALKFDAALTDSEDTDTSYQILLSGKGTGSMTADPVAIGLESDLDISAFDQSTTMTYKYYVAPDEYGDLEAYSYSGEGDDGSWDSEYLGDSDSFKEDLEALDISKLSEIGVNFTLESKAVKHNGRKCYVLSTEVSTENLSALADAASDYSLDLPSPLYDLSYMVESLDGIVLNIECYVDAKTWHLTGFHADLNNSDFNTLFSAMYGSGIEGNVKDISLDVDCTYGKVNAITIPQEALDY